MCGGYEVEIVEKCFNSQEKEALRKNLINYTESCEKTANAISLKLVDAMISWMGFQYWVQERIETIPSKKEEVIRVGYIPIAVSRYTKNRVLAQKFIDVMLSYKVKNIFRKYHYFMTPEESFAWVGEKKPVGGEYVIPKEWIKK